MQGRLSFGINPKDVTDELILKRCKTFKDALRLCRDCSPLADDALLFEIEKRTGRIIQKGHLSECLNGGNRNFPPELIQTLEDICSNWIPTRFLALSRNCELKPKKEALELKIEELERAIAEKDKELEIVAKWKAKGII